MMTCYYGVFGTVVTSSVFKYQIPEYSNELIESVIQYLYWILIPATFVFMFLAARKGIGPKYAVKNTILAVIFSSVVIGFIIWPLLVRNEIRKHKLALDQRPHLRENRA